MFPKIKGTLLGVPIIRTLAFLGSILGSPYFGKLPYELQFLRSSDYSSCGLCSKFMGAFGL